MPASQTPGWCPDKEVLEIQRSRPSPQGQGCWKGARAPASEQELTVGCMASSAADADTGVTIRSRQQRRLLPLQHRGAPAGTLPVLASPREQSAETGVRAGSSTRRMSPGLACRGGDRETARAQCPSLLPGSQCGGAPVYCGKEQQGPRAGREGRNIILRGFWPSVQCLLHVAAGTTGIPGSYTIHTRLVWG